MQQFSCQDPFFISQCRLKKKLIVCEKIRKANQEICFEICFVKRKLKTSKQTKKFACKKKMKELDTGAKSPLKKKKKGNAEQKKPKIYILLPRTCKLF